MSQPFFDIKRNKHTKTLNCNCHIILYHFTAHPTGVVKGVKKCDNNLLCSFIGLDDLTIGNPVKHCVVTFELTSSGITMSQQNWHNHNNHRTPLCHLKLKVLIRRLLLKICIIK